MTISQDAAKSSAQNHAQHDAQHDSSRRSLIPWLLALGPMLAVIGGMITLYLVIKHPDTEWKVDPVTEVTTEQGTHQHVVNSVTPPLK